MRKTKVATDEVINRVCGAEETIYDWMTSNNIVETTPELCMKILVDNQIYKFDSKGKGHYFREDVRTLRDNDLLETTFKRIAVKQRKPGAPWFIEIGKNI